VRLKLMKSHLLHLLSTADDVTVFAICWVTYCRGILRKPSLILLISTGLAALFDLEILSLGLLHAGMPTSSIPPDSPMNAIQFFNRTSTLISALLAIWGITWLLIIAVRLVIERHRNDVSGHAPINLRK